MSHLSHFLTYAREFEIAQLTDDFDRVAPFFAEDAVHRVDAVGPMGADAVGRDALVAGLRTSVGRIDRRFDVRIPEVLEGPYTRDDGVWMRFRLRLRRAGVPELTFEGEHLTVYAEDGRIARIEERILDAADERVDAHLAEYASRLRPAGSPMATPCADDLALLRDANQRTLVRCYGHAKSEQDAEAALVHCHPDFAIDTIPFGITTEGREDTARQLGLFFSVFPDYAAHTEGLVSDAEGAAWWGRARMTFGGPLFGRAPTGATADIPAFSVFEFRGGQLVRERFMFDLPSLCEGIELPLDELLGALGAIRDAA